MMADVSTYRRCTTTYATTAKVYHEGDVRAAGDPDVVAVPTLWTPLTDAVLADASLEEEV